MTRKFSAFDTAIKMRNIMRKVAGDELLKSFPPDSFAVVDSVDFALKRAYVFYPGETTSVPVNFWQVVPTRAGQVVRITGAPSDRYICDLDDDQTSADWIAPTLGNGWVDYGGGFQGAEYRKIGDMVQLRGMIKSGSNGVPIFVLPTGYRPPAHLYLPTLATSTPALGILQINNSGAVYAMAGANTHFNIGCQFSTTA